MRIRLFTARPILNASSPGEMRLSRLVALPIQLELVLTSRRRSEGDAARPGTIATVTRRGSICCGRGGHQSRTQPRRLDQGEPRLSHLSRPGGAAALTPGADTRHARSGGGIHHLWHRVFGIHGLRTWNSRGKHEMSRLCGAEGRL